ncbi:MAG: hypothetical protein AAGA05_11145 [Pseudomonadota bacterium]
MTRHLEFTHDYPVEPDRLFALAADLDALDVVNKPMVQFAHLPSGPVREGQTIDVDVSLFGILPNQPYRMHVALCDPAARHIRSIEDGMGVQKLIHDVHVEATEFGARLVDHLEIEAGWRTPFVSLWVWVMYRRRHRHRLRLLGV